MRTTPILLAVAAVFINCATLISVTADTCGNGVVEPNEDCDSTSTTCGQPTADAAHACHYLCDPDPTKNLPCTVGSCSADGVCRVPAGTFASVLPGVSTNVSTLLAGDFDHDYHTDLIGSPPYGSAGSSRVHYFDTQSALGDDDAARPADTARDGEGFDGDHLDDLGFAVRTLGFGAFGALKGQKDRTFATVLFPALTYPSSNARWTVVNERANVQLPGTTTSCVFGLLDGVTDVNTKATANQIVSVCDDRPATLGSTRSGSPTSFRPTSSSTPLRRRSTPSQMAAATSSSRRARRCICSRRVFRPVMRGTTPRGCARPPSTLHQPRSKASTSAPKSESSTPMTSWS